ncbi:MAG: hypothetical protein KAS64_08440 [Spirochaetes bacterium]|nr:hypothetical protein [Spirochaetota bacterium]
MDHKKRFLFLFLDGIGMGDSDSVTNPFLSPDLSFIPGFFKESPFVRGASFDQDNACVFPVDPRMDTPGLPQSATGQTALLTGKNSCELAGRHVHAFPTEPLRKLLNDYSLLKVLKKGGYDVTSANAYSHKYFDIVENTRAMKYSASTLAIKAADIPFLMIEDLVNNKAVFHDLTNRRLKKYYPDIHEISIEKAAGNLAAIVKEHDFTMFEYFLSDMAGHNRNDESPIDIIRDIDCFLEALISRLDLRVDTVLIISDHGNIEDSTGNSHTGNDVPCIILSENKETRKVLRDKIHKIEDFYHSVLNWFG